MPDERFFATDEAEKAARYDMIVARKQAQEHLATLRGQARKIGEALVNFGTVLSNPSWTFEVENEKIVGTSLPEVGRRVVIPREYLGDLAIRLVSDLQRASEDLKSKTEAVRDIALGIA